MGNNLAATAPSQVLPVEKYLQDHVFEIHSLGSTRFMKVVRAKTAPNVSVVAKVFVIPDPKLTPRIDSYKEANKLLTGKLIGENTAGLGLVGDCCLPFDYVVQDCNYSGRFLTRAYLAANLFDRLYTRPFLATIERKFIAFQILVAVARAHSKVVRHGDLKLENILLTSWNWVQVSDFAFFKPVYLPDDNPAGFNFYFDASRRRTCNIAPERFIPGGDASLRDDRFFEITNSAPSFDSSGNDRSLMPSMDIFSLGCVIGQLFSENHLFNLSELLSYKCGSGYSPKHVIDKIADEGIRNLVWDMIKVNPSERKSADEYLCEYRGDAFPEYFYTILYNFMRSFTTPRSCDRNIVLLFDHYPSICDRMREHGFSQGDLDDMTLIVFSLVLSNLRSLKVAHSKLCALRLIERMCGNLKSDEILVRAVPSLVYFLKDKNSSVVATAIHSLTNSLKNVNHVTRSQRKVFVEYIFPDLLENVFMRTSKMTSNEQQVFCVESVQHAFVNCFPHLVEMSQKFLDLSIYDSQSQSTDSTSQSNFGFSYDEELRTLRNAVMEFYLPIFSKASGLTKQIFLESDILKLCAFHGNQPDHDTLAQYLPTCASVAAYWPLNESYFKNIVKVCAYYGEKKTRHNVLTFIEQGLHNTEEFVIVETLNAVQHLYKMNLIDGNDHKLKLFESIVPLLLHPNPWIRLNTARAIAEAVESVGPTTARGCIHPRVNEYARNFRANNHMLAISPPNRSQSTSESLLKAYDKLNLFKAKWGLSCVNNPSILLSTIEPIRRFCYDKLCSYAHPLEQLLHYCESLVLVRNIEERTNPGLGHNSVSGLEFPDSFEEQDKQLVQALYFEDRDSGKGYDARPDLHKTKMLKDHVMTRKQYIQQFSGMGPDYNQQKSYSEVWLPDCTPVIVIRSNADALNPALKSRAVDLERNCCSTIRISTLPGSKDVFSISLNDLKTATLPNQLDFSKLKLFARTSSVLSDNSTAEKFASSVMGPAFYTETPCLGYLRVLARHWKRNNKRRIDYLAKQRDKAAVVTVPCWRPVGSYVASLHDHSSAVNQIAVSPSNTLFATCSNDGTCRIWNPSKWERCHQDPLDPVGKVDMNRKPVKSLAFLSNDSIVASLNDALHIINLERTSKEDPKAFWKSGLVRNVGSEEGSVVAITTNENVVTVSTNRNSVFGWDMRSKGLNNAYYFQTKPHDGLISAMVVAENGLCVVLGSSLGRFSVWDLRFLMPVKTFAPHVSLTVSNKFKVPAVHRLKRHGFDKEAVIASMRGHFEISVWKLESGSRSKIFWSSPCSPLDYQQGGSQAPSSAAVPTTTTNNYAMGFYAAGSSESDFHIISGGSDKRVRFWDISNPGRSYVVSNSIQPPGLEQTFHYNYDRVAISRDNNYAVRSNSVNSKRLSMADSSEYVEVIRESISETHRQVMFRRGPELPAFSHRDLVTDVNVVTGQKGTPYLLSSDMSGVVKVWK